MRNHKVKDLMIPLSDYATVSINDTLGQALKELKKAQTDPRFTHKHRAVLVYDDDNHIVGKLGIWEILKALEPKYLQFEHPESANSFGLSRFGFSPDFLHSLVEQFGLWNESINDLVNKASSQTVKELMYTPSHDEFIKYDAFVATAVHQFIIGCHQSLLVQKEDAVIGILRLADIIDLICDIA